MLLGLRPDGKREAIDFRLAKSESQAEWEAFLTDLQRRGPWWIRRARCGSLHPIALRSSR